MESCSVSCASSSSDCDSFCLFSDQKRPKSVMEGGVNSCKDFYARRVQSLERFREKTLHRIHQKENPDTGYVFMRLQSDMVSLMESDVSLTRQLISLAERIEQLKSSTIQSDDAQCISTASSMVSLDGIDEEDLKTIDEAGVTMLTVAPLAGTSSDEEVPDEPNEDIYAVPNKQYFSRQNSVLRIPIPPSRRHRMRAVSDNRGAGSAMKRGSNGNSSTTSSSDGDGTGSCASSRSYTIGWYARKKSNTNHVDRVRMVSAGISRHQGSCDSGVHHLNYSLDVLDKEDTVFV